MKTCPNCQAQMDDNAVFCTVCGTQVDAPQQNVQNGAVPPPPPPVQPYVPYVMPDPADHTAEFDPKDISDNKPFAMLVYLFGAIGIIIAMLSAKDSAYVNFHVRQAIKFMIVEVLISLITALTFWTFIVPILAGIALIILVVLEIICFFQVCSGKAKEPAIIRSLNFLK